MVIKVFDKATKIMSEYSAQEQQILAGLDSAIGGIPSFIFEIFSKYVSPLIAVFMVGLLLITFGKTGFSSSRMKETFEANMFAILVQVIILVISLSFTVWGWTMLGGV